MQGNHGITENTPDRLVLDAGIIYLGAIVSDNMLGATRGGVEWNLNRAFRNMEVDGALGDIKGMKRRENVRPTVAVNALEITLDNLRHFIAGSYEPYGEDNTLKGGEINLEDYIDEINIIGIRSDGATVRITLTDCLAEGDWSLAQNDRDEAVANVTFVAHFDPEDLDEEPWEIEIEPAA